MKKLLLIPALLGTMAIAKDYNYEITPVIGYNIAEGNLNLDNEILGGLEVQFNDIDSPIKPELSILHSSGVKSENLSQTDTTSAGKTNITRFGLNGVYEFAASDSLIPFAKAGVGYETMSKSITNNSDGGFVDAGAGVKIPFTDELALKLEALYMLKYNDNSAGGNWGDSNLALLAGLNYSFGEKAQKAAPAPVDGDDDKDGVLNSIDKCPTTPAGDMVDATGCTVDGDDDNDGVLNSIDKCPTTPAGDSVDASGCTVIIDSDNDGVADSIDLCPETPAGDTVNEDGCPNVVNLALRFANDSTEIKNKAYETIQFYADFLNKNRAYKAHIVGYTSNTGSASYNLDLSKRRATAVKNALVSRGAPAESITTDGKGVANPVASNDTPEGRTANRRIEAELTKN